MTPGGAITAHNANDFEHRQPDYLKAITTDPNLEPKITRSSEAIRIAAKNDDQAMEGRIRCRRSQ